jgi:hypothetical protein
MSSRVSASCRFIPCTEIDRFKVVEHDADEVVVKAGDAH